MQLGVIGLGRMGGNIVRRLMRGGRSVRSDQSLRNAFRSASSSRSAPPSASNAAAIVSPAKPRARSSRSTRARP